MELIRALAALVDEPSPASARLAEALELGEWLDRAGHADLFLFQLYPYASVYLGAEGMLGGEARERIAGFWRAVGHEAPPEPDHLGALLGLYATLSDSERDESDPARRLLRRRARGALLWEHLLAWLPPWLARVDEIAPDPGSRWAALLADVLRREARELEAPAFPTHLAEAPELEDPRAGAADAFLAQTLAPARTGMILVRDDLARCAHETGLGLRQGERRYVLEALLGQDAPATLAWLAAETERQGGRVADGWSEPAPRIVDFWSGRARAATTLLASLAAEAVTP